MALASARAGVGRVVVVEAAAGCGKTALLHAARERAAGFLTLVGRGGEFERSAGFGVVRDLYAAALAQGQPADVLTGAARLAGPLVAGDRMRASALDAAALNHGLYWLTANLAAQRPLVLAVDDAQWADVASLRFLEYLAARIESVACLLAVAWRPGESDADEGFVGRVLALEGCSRVPPKPLSREGSRRLVLSRSPEGVSEEILARCHEATAGNPFLLHELASAITLRSAAGEEALPRDWLAGGPAAAGADSVPEPLIRIVRARVSRLPEPARAVAEALAVLGPRAALRHAAEVAGVSRQQAARAADALAAADLIRPKARIDFVHPLIRRTVYDMQPAAARAEAHGRAARILAAEDADPELIAGHLLVAPAAADQGVVDQLLAAARTAMERGAPDAAMRYLGRALNEPPDEAARAPVLRALGNAESRAARREGIAHLRDAFARTRDPSERLDIALDIGQASTALGPAQVDQAKAEIGAALAAQDGDSEPAMLARAWLLYWSIASTDGPSSRAHAERARTMYARTQAGFGRRVLAAALAFADVWSNQPAAVVHALACDALGDDEAYERALAVGWQLAWCCPTLAVAGEWDLAERRLTQALVSGQQRGSRRAARNALWVRTAVRALRGDLAGAEDDGRQALEWQREPPWHSIIVLSFGVSLVDVLIDRSSPAAAQTLLEELGLEGDPGSVAESTQLLCVRSRLRLVQGKADAALADSLAARHKLRRAGLNPIALFSADERVAAAFAACGRHDEARAAAAEALRLAQIHDAPGPIGMAMRTAALLEHGPEQVGRLAAAVPLLACSGHKLEHARALIDLGAAMRRQGERAAARTPLSQGRDLAHRCGARALEERATQELRASGAKPRRIMVGGADSLTPSERRVAQMAADGLTSRTIAEQLFVTQKTIETHLGHIYSKLDIPGRKHIAAALGSHAGTPS